MKDKISSLRSLIISLSLSLCASLVVWALWTAGLLGSLQAAFVLAGASERAEAVTPQIWLGALLILAVGTGAGFAVERAGARRASPFIAGGQF